MTDDTLENRRDAYIVYHTVHNKSFTLDVDKLEQALCKIVR